MEILRFIAGMPPFQARSIDPTALARAQKVERFSFLLNGWNEIGESESSEAEHALRELERLFPSAGIIVATRTHHIVPPLPGAIRLRLLTISRHKGAAYLRARLGSRADEFHQKLLSDRVLDGLTRTPFILSEITSIFEAGEPIPTTKIGVLNAVTRLLEQSHEHRNHLQQEPLVGRARNYMQEIALRVTARGGATISDEDARSTANFVAARLREAGQLATLPEPAAVLNTLCAHHVLERLDYPSIAFRFEHQQFQEFYAALEIRRQLLDIVAKKDERETRVFAKNYVNEPSWTEVLRMIADDISGLTAEASRSADAVQAGRILVEMALQIDPVFSAELSQLCGASVWQEVRPAVVGRLRALYSVPEEHYRQLALAAMLASGSDEFRDIIVPILSGESQQDRLGAYRAWSEFHLSSLGPNWTDAVRYWKDEARVGFVSEILHNRNVSEVVSFALADPSLKVKEAAIKGLAWIGAEDDAIRFLKALVGEPEDMADLRDLIRADIERVKRGREARARGGLGTEIHSLRVAGRGNRFGLWPVRRST